MDYRKPFSKLGEESKGLHLLYTIWTKPTATLRFVLANFPDKYVTVLLALGGTARAVDRAARQHDGNFLTLNQVSPIALLIGALSGWLTYYVYGWALSATGKWLGGNAQPEEARTVLAWALVPLISGLGLIVLYVAFFNNELLKLFRKSARVNRNAKDSHNTGEIWGATHLISLASWKSCPKILFAPGFCPT